MHLRSGPEATVITVGDLRFDLGARLVYRNGEEIHLTPYIVTEQGVGYRFTTEKYSIVESPPAANSDGSRRSPS